MKIPSGAGTTHVHTSRGLRVEPDILVPIHGSYPVSNPKSRMPGNLSDGVFYRVLGTRLQCLVHFIYTLLGTGQFIPPLPLVKRPSLCTPGNVGYSDILVPIQMIFPLFVHCMSLRLVVGVVSELVACTNVRCRPPHQRIYFICCTYQLGTRMIEAVRIRIRGGGGGPTTKNISPHNVITYPVIEQWDAWRSRDKNIHSLIHSFIHTEVYIFY